MILNLTKKSSTASAVFVLQKLSGRALLMWKPCYPLQEKLPHETLASGHFVKLLPLQSLPASTRQATGALASILDHKVEERVKRRENKILTKNHQEPSMFLLPMKPMGSVWTELKRLDQIGPGWTLQGDSALPNSSLVRTSVESKAACLTSVFQM